jgi:hypothetical protein
MRPESREALVRDLIELVVEMLLSERVISQEHAHHSKG